MSVSQEVWSFGPVVELSNMTADLYLEYGLAGTWVLNPTVDNLRVVLPPATRVPPGMLTFQIWNRSTTRVLDVYDDPQTTRVTGINEDRIFWISLLSNANDAGVWSPRQQQRATTVPLIGAGAGIAMDGLGDIQAG